VRDDYLRQHLTDENLRSLPGSGVLLSSAYLYCGSKTFFGFVDDELIL